MHVFDLKTGEPTKAKRSNNEIQNVNENIVLLQLLADIGIPHVYDKFLDEEISSKTIWKLTEQNLRDMGLKWGSINKFKDAYQRSKGIKHNKF